MAPIPTVYGEFMDFLRRKKRTARTPVPNEILAVLWHAIPADAIDQKTLWKAKSALKRKLKLESQKGLFGLILLQKILK